MVAEAARIVWRFGLCKNPWAATDFQPGIKSPRNFWKEALPGRENSYVRRLAEDFSYVCPVLGGEVSTMLRQGRPHWLKRSIVRDITPRRPNYMQPCFEKARHPAADSSLVSRCSPRAHDEAFKICERPTIGEPGFERSWRFDRGYLALCGAKVAPSTPRTNRKTSYGAIRTLASFQLHGDPEWAQFATQFFAEARS